MNQVIEIFQKAPEVRTLIVDLRKNAYILPKFSKLSHLEYGFIKAKNRKILGKLEEQAASLKRLYVELPLNYFSVYHYLRYLFKSKIGGKIQLKKPSWVPWSRVLFCSPVLCCCMVDSRSKKVRKAE